MLPTASFGTVFFSLTLVSLAATFPQEPSVRLEQIRERLDRADRESNAMLASYSAVRVYTIQHARMGGPAEMKVRVAYSAEHGKTFDVLSINAEGMQKKVLERILDAERESSQPRNAELITLNSRNYDFELLGTEETGGVRCFVLKIKPKRKGRMLLEGKAWISSDDFGLVRLEGRPQERVSFWVGRPQVTQTFRKVGPVWIMASNHSIADVRLLGKAELMVQASGFDVKIRERNDVASARGPAGVASKVDRE